MQKAIISIVTPTYNQNKYLSKTIESLFAQKGHFFIDYIIIDGGSTDGTKNTIRRFNEILKFHCNTIKIGKLTFYTNKNNVNMVMKCCGISYRWLSERDKGQADAINKGFQMAIGEIMCWINSDDTYYGYDALNKVLDFFIMNSNADFMHAKGYSISRSGRIIAEEGSIGKFNVSDLAEIDYILQPSTFWKKRVWKDVGILDLKLQYCFDWDYWLRISKKYKLYYLDDYISCYRIHGEAKTQSGKWNRSKEIIEFLVKNKSLTTRALQCYLPYEVYNECDRIYKIVGCVLFPYGKIKKMILFTINKLTRRKYIR